jgi:hypothetical protein
MVLLRICYFDRVRTFWVLHCVEVVKIGDISEEVAAPFMIEVAEKYYWMFYAGINRVMWVPIATAWRVLGLWMEKTASRYGA